MENVFAFLVFVVLQSLAINGVKEAMSKDMILEGFAFWLKSLLGEYWFKPFGSCVRCMSSVYGTITFFGTVVPIFGFHLFEIWVWFWDIFILVTVNWIIYKKI